jgi:trehalose-6-phosphatase
MGLDRIHPTMTAYHGECRLAVIRVEWKGSGEERRAVLMAEAEAIKKYQTTETP